MEYFAERTMETTTGTSGIPIQGVFYKNFAYCFSWRSKVFYLLRLPA